MSETDALDERLRAVERALTDDDADLTDLRDAADLTREVERLAARLDEAEERLDELDAATQALRGYVGNVRAVNESVERRADAALAKAEALEDERADRSERRPESDCPCHCECRRSDRAIRVEAESDAESERRPRERSAGDSGLLARVTAVLPGTE